MGKGRTLLGVVLLVAALVLWEDGQKREYTIPKTPDAPLVIAHRAGAARGPENTVAALERAIAAGADMAEIDVGRTRDGVLVVLHDDTLRRTTGVDGTVRDTRYEVVRRLDAGSWYSIAFAGEPIPTLEEMLWAARGRIPLMIELKYKPGDWTLVEKTVALIRDLNMEGQCVLGCSDLVTLHRSKQLLPELETVYIGGVLFPGMEQLAYVNGFSIRSENLAPEDVARLQGAGKSVYAWTVNTVEELQRVLDMNLDGVVTDDPDLALRSLKTGAGQ